MLGTTLEHMFESVNAASTFLTQRRFELLFGHFLSSLSSANSWRLIEEGQEMPVEDFNFDPVVEPAQELFEGHETQHDVDVERRVIHPSVKFKMWIEFGVRLMAQEVESRYWVAVMQRLAVEPVAGVRGSLFKKPIETIELKRGFENEEKSVLVGVDEFIEDVEPVGLRAAARVRLYGYESVADVRVADRARAKGKGVALLVGGLLFTNRKIAFEGSFAVLEYRELKVEVVEGRPQVSEEVAEGSREIGVYDGNAVYPIDVLRRISIEFTPEHRSVSYDKSVSPCNEVAGVEAGSRELGVYPLEGCRRSHA